MDIEIISKTPNPLDVISLAAGTCYGKSDTNAKRAKTCYQSGHMSVFEHANVTFKISGISRACSHQLVRHRLASFCQESQRYCRIDTDADDWFVIPPELDDNGELTQFFTDSIMGSACDYQEALRIGIRPEDARYMLPEACKTKLTVTMNVRELFHFFDMRQDKAAQWEIRNLAHLLEETLAQDPQWSELLALRH